MRKYGGLSFRLKLIITVICCVAAIEVINMVWSFDSERRRLNDSVEVQAGVTANIVKELVALPLWDFNYPVLQAIFESLSRDPLIEHAALADANGKMVAEWGIAPTEGNSVSLERSVIYDDLGQNETIGRLEIHFSLDGVTAALAAHSARAFLSNSIVLVALIWILSAVLGRLFRPLDSLVGSIERIKSGVLNQPVGHCARKDEIGKMAVALEHLRANEAEMAILRRENEIVSRNERDRMILALSATEDAVLLIDENGYLAFCNQRAGLLFGGLVVSQKVDFLRVFDAKTSDKIDKAISDRLRLDGESVFTLDLDGVKRDINIRIDAISGDEGKALGVVFLATDVTAQTDERRRADHAARHDGLTGLPNRRYMEEHLADLRKRRATEVGLFLADLDRFKQINDTMGHHVGDMLLQKISVLLNEILEPGDTGFRLGGDEFAIISVGPNAVDRLGRHAADLQALLGQPIQIDDLEIQTGMSAGIAIADMETVSQSDILQRADLALYEAKRLGRGQFCLFRAEFQHAALRKVEIQDGLRQALVSEDSIFCVFQTQTDFVTGSITGFEALARWRAEDGNLVSPVEFIPVAEETGLIEELTTRIMKIAMKAARQAYETGFGGRMAINISPRLFNGRLVEMLCRAMEETGCPATSLEIEITEQVILSSDQQILDYINAIRAMGVTVALDDFGMGYSSLSYLQKFSVDKIKIDREFISRASTSPQTHSIIMAISELGRALHMTVTAEGLENMKDFIALEDCRIDDIQGWINGMPLIYDEFQELIGNKTWWDRHELVSGQTVQRFTA